MRLVWLAVAWLTLQLAVTACSRGDGAEREDTHASKAAPAPAGQRAARSGIEPGELHRVASATVQGRTGPGGQPFDISLRTVPGQLGHSRRFGSRTLSIALRTRAPELGASPCTSCHMGRANAMTSERIADAHPDVQPVHPAETGAGCATCHAAANVELLVLESGDRASLDHAYRLCAQCHSTQVNAWANGAHGKRLDGWQGRRVVMNCSDCHDPHAPALRNRMPFRPPRLHRTEK